VGKLKNLLLEQLETNPDLADRYWLQQEQYLDNSSEPPTLANEAEVWYLPPVNGNDSFDELPF